MQLSIKTILATSLVLFASATAHATTIKAECLRDGGPQAGCTCMQNLANKHLNAQERKMGAQIMQKPGQFMTIALGLGENKMMVFLERWTNYAEKVNAQCDVPNMAGN